ncbi:MAG TPA: PGPGW domain-containing protein [Planctomycetota bacterium]|nr:PGPGW domain-containing protein [Planctomycetota bacterium]
MFKNMRENWKQLKSADPGRRFQDLYETRQKKQRSKLARVFTLAIAVVLIIVGPIAGLIPGPGGIVIFAVGLALLAGESRIAARAIDRCEEKLRSWWQHARASWKRS